MLNLVNGKALESLEERNNKGENINEKICICN